MQTYGKFDHELDGRLSGHVIYVGPMRRDGKFKVTHVFGSGKRIVEILTRERLDAEIAKLQSVALDQTD